MYLKAALPLFALLSTTLVVATPADSEKNTDPPPKPCTIRSTLSGNFFDLNSLAIKLPKEEKEKEGKRSSGTKVTPESWHIRGYDYGVNFTMNICAPVVEDLDDVVGVSKSAAKNVSAYYTKGGETYSMGTLNTELVIRGRKLVLNYTHGSPCGSSSSSIASLEESSSTHIAITPRNYNRASYFSSLDSDLHPDNAARIAASSSSAAAAPASLALTRHKSTVISFICDHEPVDPSQKASIAFIGTDEDECTYMFEAKSQAACPGVETTPQQLGPGGVFGVIMLIALLVYFAGGCVYQRTVMHQRGWKQLPNYALWAGLFGFLYDMFIILTASCARFMPGRRGYSRLSLSGDSRSRHSDDQNRLIDQLDEEWDD